MTDLIAKSQVDRAERSDTQWIHKKRCHSEITDDGDKKNETNPPNKAITLAPNNVDDNKINLNIYSRDTDIYFYTNINDKTAVQFQTEVSKVYKSILQNINDAQLKGYELAFPPIKIHFNSPGGGIFAAFSMIDYLRLLKQRDPRIIIHTIVEGRAASAATLISVTGDRRFCMKYGYMLIHQLNSATWGKYNEIKDDVENLDELMRRIKRIYKDFTQVPKEELDSILLHDIYWNSKKCLRMGLVDEIL